MNKLYFISSGKISYNYLKIDIITLACFDRLFKYLLSTLPLVQR